jgi:hypothetical protein
VDTTRVAQPRGDDHHEDVEAHYSALERLEECPACFGGYVTIGVEEDGQDHDEAVPCRRCADSR